MKKIITLFALFLILIFTTAMTSSNAKPAKSAEGTFIGVFREGAPSNMNYIQNFVKETGKKPATIMWYQDWDQKFPRADAQKVIDFGAIPHIVWEPWFWGEQEKIKLDNIIRGQWDNYIREWAKEIKDFGHPIFLRIAHEFNIEGYPWGVVNNNRDPKKYIQAYRHIVDIFKREKADNAKWVWCFMNFSHPKEDWNDYEAAYPGDDYVDWVGIDGYNWGTVQKWSEWTPFKYLFREQMRRMRKLHPHKPIMVAEFAAAEKGGNKAAWIKELPGYLKSSMKDIKLIIWFDHKKETDWRINSSEKSLAAFKSIMQDAYFLSSGKELAELLVTPPFYRFEKKEVFASRSNPMPIIMDSKEYFKEGLTWAGPKDLSGKIYLRWDEQYLYVKADVADSMPLVNNKNRRDIWNGDAIEIVISTNPKADPQRGDFEYSDYQIGLSTGNGKNVKPQIWCWQKSSSLYGSSIEVKKKASSKGYILEAKIAWSSLGSYVPRVGDRAGFDIAIDDADKSGERERQLIWNGDFYFYKDPSVWGTLIFTK